MFEQEALTFTAIAARLGCHRDTVSAHARREHWVDPAEIQRQASRDRGKKILQQFIRRDAQAVLENLTAKHRLTHRILELAHREVERLTRGEIRDGEDPVQSMRRLALALQSIEVVDRSLVGAGRGPWLNPGDTFDFEKEDETIRKILDELDDGRIQ